MTNTNNAAAIAVYTATADQAELVITERHASRGIEKAREDLSIARRQGSRNVLVDTTSQYGSSCGFTNLLALELRFSDSKYSLVAIAYDQSEVLVEAPQSRAKMLQVLASNHAKVVAIGEAQAIRPGKR